MKISTERLVLREYDAGDLGAVHAFASDPVVCAFADWGPNSVQETRDFLAQCAADQAAEPRATWTLAITLNGEVIGSVALMTGESDVIQGPDEAEIGYLLRTDAWGNGYATEAAAALLAWARNSLAISRITATCRPENIGSVRVLERIGLRQTDYLRGHKTIDGQSRDSVVFSCNFPPGDAVVA